MTDQAAIGEKGFSPSFLRDEIPVGGKRFIALPSLTFLSHSPAPGQSMMARAEVSAEDREKYSNVAVAVANAIIIAVAIAIAFIAITITFVVFVA